MEGSQGETKVLPLFANTIQVLFNELKSKFNEWYVDYGNRADDSKNVQKELTQEIISE